VTLPEAQDLRLPLGALAERWVLPRDAAGRYERLLRFLAGDPSAPSSVTDPRRAVDVHVADSLSGFQVEGFRSLESVVDIGSGAGFPGLVLAIAMSGTRFDLVEASNRKCVFLERAVSAVGLENVDVVCCRAEEWAAGAGAGAYAGAAVRAVGRLATLVEYAAPLLEIGGKLVAWKGRRDREEEHEGERAAAMLGMRQIGVEWVGPFAGSRNRHLHVYEKVAACPPGYPRRAGMARKRPRGRR
jgi:16S rRNA (guanine527-N7)-methyltransferase